MTQNNDMPDEIYVRLISGNAKGGHKKKTLSAVRADSPLIFERTRYIRAALTPPQSPNRAVLDALDKWDNQGEINHEELCLFIECAREHLKRQKGR